MRICGFCEIRDEKQCFGCEVKDISQNLQTLANKVQWEHDIKYRADGEEEINNCAHCKHVICDGTCYQAAHDWNLEVYCRLEMDENGYFPQRKPYDVCPKWERAAL